MHTLVTYIHCKGTKVLNLAFRVNVFVHACVCEREKERESYYVPTTLFVFASIWSSPNILAKPKSEIFGFITASSRTLLAFRSLWMIFSLESWWRYKTPQAIPEIISNRFFQSNNCLLIWSGPKHESFHWSIMNA